ncbi:hypothetical protein N7509_004197 [Penicillium cosmopolitanum]|uniref:Uncharacterized protein n=1 Tax=Penicillium cosmopolitanum TaxID=1131564 RepID=A0A9W9W6J9_9EURO|nr:uncharacterized protein N7509_004197 [Penicillium cosmopolitanum]KAJ5404326.1 hypothetical protein N7509_004197 [Penicillium cosmopolitanum]
MSKFFRSSHGHRLGSDQCNSNRTVASYLSSCNFEPDTRRRRHSPSLSLSKLSACNFNSRKSATNTSHDSSACRQIRALNDLQFEAAATIAKNMGKKLLSGAEGGPRPLRTAPGTSARPESAVKVKRELGKLYRLKSDIQSRARFILATFEPKVPTSFHVVLEWILCIWLGMLRGPRNDHFEWNTPGTVSLVKEIRKDIHEIAGVAKAPTWLPLNAASQLRQGCPCGHRRLTWEGCARTWV